MLSQHVGYLQGPVAPTIGHPQALTNLGANTGMEATTPPEPSNKECLPQQKSDAQELIHHRLAEITGGAAGDDAATLHRVIAIGLSHEVQVLLHQQHTNPGLGKRQSR